MICPVEIGPEVSALAGRELAKAYIHTMLRNEFYCGSFFWEKQRYKGTHPAIISHDLFAEVQTVLDGHNKPKYRKRDFAFGGLLTCPYDDCMVTAEFNCEWTSLTISVEGFVSAHSLSARPSLRAEEACSCAVHEASVTCKPRDMASDKVRPE